MIEVVRIHNRDDGSKDIYSKTELENVYIHHFVDNDKSESFKAFKTLEELKNGSLRTLERGKYGKHVAIPTYEPVHRDSYDKALKDAELLDKEDKEKVIEKLSDREYDVLHYNIVSNPSLVAVLSIT